MMTPSYSKFAVDAYVKIMFVLGCSNKICFCCVSYVSMRTWYLGYREYVNRICICILPTLDVALQQHAEFVN